MRRLIVVSDTEGGLDWLESYNVMNGDGDHPFFLGGDKIIKK